MIAWVFPGQGSQKLAMGTELRSDAAGDVFTTAYRMLGWDVREVFTTPSLPARTEIVQPGVYVVSVAAARALEALGHSFDVVAGHSLGEFASLHVAGALSFEDGLRAVRARAQAMARAGAQRPGAMAAILGLDCATVQRVCDATGPGVVVANVNAPDQIVISGDEISVASASERARMDGGRVRKLNVSVAAHSPFMEPAAETLSAALESISFAEPHCPVADGRTGELYRDAATIRTRLVAGVLAPVEWVGVVSKLTTAGVTRFVEVGPGTVLSGLIKRCAPGARTFAVESDHDIEALRHELLEGGAR